MRSSLPRLLPLAFLIGACGSPDDGEGGGGEGLPGDPDAGLVDTPDAFVPPDATDWNAVFEEVLPDDHVVEVELEACAVPLKESAPARATVPNRA